VKEDTSLSAERMVYEDVFFIPSVALSSYGGQSTKNTGSELWQFDSNKRFESDSVWPPDQEFEKI